MTVFEREEIRRAINHFENACRELGPDKVEAREALYDAIERGITSQFLAGWKACIEEFRRTWDKTIPGEPELSWLDRIRRSLGLLRP